MLFKRNTSQPKHSRPDQSWIVTYENIDKIKMCTKIEKTDPSCFIEFTLSHDPFTGVGTKIMTLVLLLFLVLLNCVVITLLGPTIQLAVTLVVLSTIVAVFWRFTTVTSETVTVIPKVGICSTRHSPMKDSQIFVPWDTIEDVIINEVIVLHEVVFYLTILVKKTDSPETVKLVPLFTVVRPRLAALEKMYVKIQDLMTNTKLNSNLLNDRKS